MKSFSPCLALFCWPVWLVVVVAGFLTVGAPSAVAQPAPADNGSRLMFRQTPIDVQAINREGEPRMEETRGFDQPSLRSGATSVRAASERADDRAFVAGAEERPLVGGIDDSARLLEQRATTEAELRYGRTKLEAARRRIAAGTLVANPEQLERAQQELVDWEARVRTAEAQMAQLEGELARVTAPAAGGGTAGEVILPGENIEIFVREDNSFNGRHQVRRGGYIILPEVGRVMVANKTLAAAEQTIKTALEGSQLRKATVLVERLEGVDVESGPMVYLAGEFKKNRPYRIPPGTAPTLVSVILSAGGVTEQADLTRVKVMRMAANKGLVEMVNVQRIFEGSGLGSDVRLNDGDVVMVPAGSENVVYFTGNVKKAGTLTLTPGQRITCYAALIERGGFARFANLKRIHILRESGDGMKVKVPVNVVAIQKGQAADIPLQGNDIVVVPEKFFSF